jgi:acetylglutamate kinase
MSSKTNLIVVKIGGSTLAVSDTSLRDIASLQKTGFTPVVVHGGGPVITEWMHRQKLEPRFIRGRRVTDFQGLEIAVAVLSGLINKRIVAQVTAMGGKVIGLSGVDGQIFEAKQSDPDLGFVGDIVHVNKDLIVRIIEMGYVPILAPIAISLVDNTKEEPTLLNINADTAAAHIARSLDAKSLIFMTDVAGVLDSEKRLIPHISTSKAKHLIKSGIADGGMIPKLEACITALERVSTSCIIDGRSEHALLNAINGNINGTLLTL